MSVVWSPSAVSTDGSNVAQTTGRTSPQVVTAAAVLFNFVLCFINTNLFGVGPSIVVSTEIALIGIALGLVWHRTYALYTIILLLTAYFFAIMLIRSEFDPKIARDLLIPIAFFFVGRYLGSSRSADHLVTFLIIIAFTVALFEWLAPDTFVHYFDVIHYYIARGTVTGIDDDAPLFGSGFFNSSRFESRTLLPFLGDHRVSGIFLEAVSVGNFGAIAFAWVLLRDRQHYWALAAKLVAITAIVVLADARFGLYFCIFTLMVYFATPYIRPVTLFVAPFLAIVALETYAVVSWEGTWDNGILGRFLYAGHILTTLDPWQVYGLLASDIKIGVRFASNAVTDAGYAYMLMKVGLLGLAGVWALFVYTPVHDRDASRFKAFVAFYYIVLLSISASVFTIKTAALIWFLYGTLCNPNRFDTDAAIPPGTR
jgi:putative polymerase